MTGRYWTRLALGAALLSAPVGAALAADVEAGKAVFARTCAICHAVQEGQNRVGPSLFGVVGRAAGAVPNYVYSSAMKESGRTWTDDALDSFLTDPREDLPGTKMVFPGLKTGDQRADVIAYLKTLR